MSAAPSPALSVPPAAPAGGPPPVPPPVTPTPLSGQILDRGTVRRESVRAETWATDGTAKVLGDVEVDRADLRGFLTIAGALRADRVLSRGELEVVGGISARGTLEVRGQCRTLGDVTAEVAGLEGLVHVGGSLRVSRLLETRGQLTIVGSVSAGFFRADGRFDIRGTLRAPRVQATIRGASHIGTVEGSDVQFQLPARPPILRSILPRPGLDVDRIEAETVQLEGVTVQYLRGDRITVGRNCHVARYDGTIVSCHASSHLGPESRSPRPPGLSR